MLEPVGWTPRESSDEDVAVCAVWWNPVTNHSSKRVPACGMEETGPGSLLLPQGIIADTGSHVRQQLASGLPGGMTSFLE